MGRNPLLGWRNGQICCGRPPFGFRLDVSMLNAGDKKQISLPLDFLKNRKGYTATLYYQASEEKKDVVDTKKIRLENRNEVIIDLVGNSGCVLHFSILNFQ